MIHGLCVTGNVSLQLFVLCVCVSRLLCTLGGLNLLCQEDDERLDLMQKHLCWSLSDFKFHLTSFQKSPFLDFLQPRFSTEED